MKVTKSGKLRLDAKDTRVGNFVFTDEVEHVKVQDLGSTTVVRIGKRMPLGIWLTNILGMGEKGNDTLRTWVATVWSVLSPAPDNDYITDLLKAADAALKRHPEWYGIKEDATDEEDAEALNEVKEMTEFEEEVKNLAEKDDGGKEV